jgi:hypothetical protein
VNRYGAEALEHWRAYLSASFSRVENPEEFFTLLGEQADAEIEDRYLEYAGPDVPGEERGGQAGPPYPGDEPGIRGSVRGTGNAEPRQPG